jgi:hypothetical protein
MRSLFLVLSTSILALTACTAESDLSPAAGSAVVEGSSASPTELLFELLPGGATAGGAAVIQKKGIVTCVVTSIAPPGGPVHTSTSCVAEGGTTSLHDADASAVSALLDVPTEPLGGGGGIAVRKEAFVECTQRLVAPPGGPGHAEITCTSARVGPSADSCPVSEIAFTQATGCQNDGSVEFCIPRGDDAVRASVTNIAPNVECITAGGRAGCNLATQLLCFYPVKESQCTSSHGALTDRAWADVCSLASLTAVKKIVPTFFE